MMTGITERIGSGTAQRSTSSCRFSEIQIQELHNGVGDLAHNIAALSRSFYERFPPRPKYGLVLLVLHFVGDYYPVAIIAALVFFVLAIKLHWPWFFAWFGYRLDQVRYPQDLRSVFLIP